MHVRRAMVVAFGLAAGVARGQCPECPDIEYKANTGMPSLGCWTVMQSGDSGGGAVVDGKLVISSLNGVYGYASARAPFLWADGCRMTAVMRAPLAGWSSPGFRSPCFGGGDAIGRVVYAYVWSTGVALSTDRNSQHEIRLDFDAATEEHTYELVTDADGASLWIDGEVRLSMPYIDLHESLFNRINFGNHSALSGFATTVWSEVRFATARECAADRNCDGEVDLADLFSFLNCFDQSEACGDVNVDGVVNLSDFFEFLGEFDAGC